MSAPTDQSGLPATLILAPLAALLVVVCGVICLALGIGASAAGCEPSEAAGTVKGVPARLIPIYQQAAAKYHLGANGPAVLASINFNETSFGTNMKNATGSGAEGWMMFMPETWAAFGVDANGDGKVDPYNRWDAIFAAARYLRASGAPGNWREAIFAYNHADWYVQRVLGDAAKWSAIPSIEAGESCEVVAPNGTVRRMIAEADRLSAMRPRTEYVWGGSHGLSPTPRNGPFDCSSAVSHLLQVGGFNNLTMDTVALSTWGKPGLGRWVTILVKPYEPEAHTVIEFMPGVTPAEKRYWGTSSFVEPGHGPGWISESTFTVGYLARFKLRHPPGL